ncbi:MAG: cytochrome c oxidase subunit 4 [Geodermatophilaceae bacterium]|nr:cytochrome c oxidase subunit 4 [Geodermatophilaceae bacterium]
MKMEALVFNGLALFLVGSAVVYGIWAEEPIGTTALALSGGLCLIVGGFFWFVSRRIDLRPEDRQDAEIAEGAGDLGFFSPGSYWPVTLAAAAALAGAGLAFYYVWLIVIGFAAVMFAVGGLLFEYYHSPPAHD